MMIWVVFSNRNDSMIFLCCPSTARIHLHKALPCRVGAGSETEWHPARKMAFWHSCSVLFYVQHHHKLEKISDGGAVSEIKKRIHLNKLKHIYIFKAFVYCCGISHCSQTHSLANYFCYFSIMLWLLLVQNVKFCCDIIAVIVTI